MSIGVVDILDVDVFGGATDAIVCLDVNACCINVVVGIKVMLLPLSVELTAVFLILPSKSSVEV
ncbi:hypothetical protein BSPWISOXPB_361 [uncultured Gammaproteobacteria bacterium]|nr:hypothetical protein BSPWISOXPB_361 [uncultured Gammaproteobacteria bacterium]